MMLVAAATAEVGRVGAVSIDHFFAVPLLAVFGDGPPNSKS